MRRWLKMIGIAVALVVIGVGGVLAYVFLALPRVSAAADVRIERTPARVDRGRYLANHVAACIVCHSERDWTKFSAPVPADRIGNGHVWRRTDGMPGTYWARNLTPVGLAAWTDGEIVRAMTEGISRDGHALFPLMPYLKYGRLPAEDVYAIVAYLRSLPPVVSTDPPPAREVDFPLTLIIRTMPTAATPAPLPNAATDRAAYGKALVEIAHCGGCHSPATGSGDLIEGRDFSGGMEFPLQGGGVVRSANITPDPTTGIGTWTDAQFVARFKVFADPDSSALTLRSPRQNTEMPWTAYAGMTRDDLSAIYAYLRTVKPVAQKVQTFQ